VAELQDACLKRYQLTGRRSPLKGKALEHIVSAIRSKNDREAPVYLAIRDARQRHRDVHSAPAYGVEDFESCRRQACVRGQSLLR